MPHYDDAQPVKARIISPDQHVHAVINSLAWAQESADRGDYADAVGWLQAVKATGDQLSPGQQAKHQAWQAELAHGRAMHGLGGLDNDA